MLRRSCFLALVACAVAGVAFAELSQTYKDWPDSPAGYLLTKSERKAYEHLTTDAEAKAFIDLFWAKRDPDLSTPVNEFKVDYEARVEAANQQFSSERTKGSMTDRGRTLILMGRPSHFTSLPATAVAGRLENVGAEERGATEVWTYLQDKLPPDVRQEQVYFIFVESRVGLNDFHLDRSDTRNALALKLLASAPERFLLHPKLTEVPQLGLLPGSKAATAEQLAVFSAEPRPWPQGAATVTAAGMLSDSLHPLWVHIELPNDVPPATSAVGRVRPADGGADLGTFSIPVTPISVANGRAYEFSFPVDAGTWKADIALLNDAGPLAVTTVDGTTGKVPANGTFISPFYWGPDVRQEAQAHLGDPFNVGGWHVVPSTNNQYTSKDSLAYFCFVVRPGVLQPTASEDPSAPKVQPGPKFELKLALYSGDKKLTETPAMPQNLSQINGDLWMFGSSLPLTGFRKPGDYRLDLTLHDTITDVSRSVQIPITIVPEPEPTPTAGPAGPAAGQQQQQ
jgi:GWxTD domain-containing protein